MIELKSKSYYLKPSAAKRQQKNLARLRNKYKVEKERDFLDDNFRLLEIKRAPNLGALFNKSKILLSYLINTIFLVMLILAVCKLYIYNPADTSEP